MDKAQKEYREKRYERITFEGSGPALFIPQCNSCINSSNRINCKVYDIIPEEYRNDKKQCPMYKK